MSFFKKAQEKLAELQASQSEENWQLRQQQKAEATAFNEQSRPPRLIREDTAQYYGGHPHFPEYDKSSSGTLYLTQDGICWVGYPIRMIIPWAWVTGLNLMAHKSTSFTQEFIEGLNKGWGQENREYKNVLAVDFVLEGVAYQAFFHFCGALTRGIDAERAKAFLEHTVPYKKLWRSAAPPSAAPAEAKSELGRIEALERLAALHKAGHLSDEEFQQLKNKIMSELG